MIKLRFIFITAISIFSMALSACNNSISELNESDEAYIVKQRDIYIHNKDTLNSQLKNGFKPRNDLPAWPVSTPIDWAANPYDRNWRFHLNAWRMIDPYFRQYFKTKDSKFLVEAFEYVIDWHQFHLVDDNKNDYAWYDMSMGIRGLYIAYFLSADNEGIISLSANDRKILNELSKSHVKITHKLGISETNHGLFQISGLALICKVQTQEKHCDGEVAYAKKQAKKLMDKQFTADGIHKENSPSYHFFAHKLVSGLGALKHVLSDVDLDKIKSNGRWLVFPNGDIAAVGDSARKSTSLSIDAFEVCLEPSRCYGVAPFETSGYSIIRGLPSQNPESMLFVTGMAYNTIHSHSDALSFELFEFGKMIFVDSGKYGYKDDKNRDYIVSAAAHNTISLSNKNNSSADMKLTGSLLEKTSIEDGQFVVRGEVDFPKFFSQKRELKYNPGRSLKITDRITPKRLVRKDKSTKYVSSLHFAEDIKPELTENGFVARVGNHLISAELENSECEFYLTRGQADPLLGWRSVDYLKLVPISVVQAHCPQSTTEITWDIAFN